ncbi:5-formyltetrahydrofolate cyclo-ligase [Aestuariicella hydrocarbonica]|uniref:5-formyltetrahydrofolate cyclo-ligase n=1 Tax=Pseudomaricurvus hydrocarbonicus TaxID=1470433 RepID=A0A9E5T420_9GAMM|nr:5-formyltetrahydrofolate cyclo-ligase [Aestuariicella hydrocarbonica]NHO67607.1 5-formyltetrahydrofolate cyclo-ligase [Aestuariicella hydrocarbonica]
MENRQTLRKTLRARRRALSPRQQQQAAQQLLRKLKQQPLFLRSQRVAFYLPNDGEIDPRPLIREAWRRGKHCYLPVLAPGSDNHLWFVRHTPTTPLQKNRFGIPEPKALHQHRFLAQQLDVVFLPLVGFDRQGGRMGMGGGFYDRSFAFKLASPSHKPYLVGLAHHCQQVDQLQLAHWDIPLSAIATDREIIVPAARAIQRDFFT